MQFLNALTPLQWAIAAAIPLGVIALYFLKLRRRPVQIPSTYLWRKSIEDLHVNSLFQRLRRNLLLFLQLLILSLILLALLRPAIESISGGGNNHVLLIDNSASMAATDAEPTRLEWAKQQAIDQVIDKMAGDDKAMIISFNDQASVLQQPTSNRSMLRSKIQSIEQTQRPTNLRDALLLASGLANPQKFMESEGMQEVHTRTTLHIFSDGGFSSVKGVSLGALQPEYYPVGESDNNVSILAMMVRRNEDRPDELQIFGRVKNFSSNASQVRAELHINHELSQVQDVTIPARGEEPIAFDLVGMDQGIVELQLDADDLLKADNIAWGVVGSLRKARVLVVSEDISSNNRYLELALGTEAVNQLADLDFQEPAYLESDEYKGRAASGYYDLAVFDGCSPAEMPQSNTLFLGVPASMAAQEGTRKLINPAVVDVDTTHPLFRYVNMSRTIIIESVLPPLPENADVLVESGQGALAFVVSREGFADCIFGFGLYRQTDKGRGLNTNWFSEYSFPLFVYNALRVLGNVADSISEEVLLPGATVKLRSNSLRQQVTIKDPSEQEHKVQRNAQGMFVFNRTDALGVYEVEAEGDAGAVERRFAVNLFDEQEANLVPRSEFDIGEVEVKAASHVVRPRRELWRWLATCALGVLLIEWYVYNRRVYV